MQITYNHSEIETIITTHILDTLPGANPEDISSVTLNDDGTATIIIGEEVHAEDTPPVVEKQKRTRGPNKRNPQEAKHRPVDPTPEPEPEAGEQVKEPETETATETQTSTGGQNESSTPEPETAAEEPELQPEPEQPAQEETKAEEPAEKPATAKPSLFAGLKR